VLVTGMASVTVASLRRYVTVVSTLVTAPPSHAPDHTPRSRASDRRSWKRTRRHFL
jgi:hypothetical protein